MIDQVCHELHVVDAVRIAAVERRVRRDELPDPHLLRRRSRQFRSRVLEDDRRDAVHRGKRRGQNLRGGRGHVDGAPVAGRNDADAVRGDREVRILRVAIQGLLETDEECVCVLAADVQVTATV